MTSDAVLVELRRLSAEIRALRQALLPRSDADALVAAITEFFGDGRFTVCGLLQITADDPHGDIAVALADAVDLNASPRSVATRLGALLARMPQVEVVAACRGAAVYRLRT